ncbi:carboxymuconolactone decarboxylase family protein [Actinoplanes sp. NPDC051513]|uniref:carboxymuconolactone decarboxylase family protein n=1 Tax=Actinoplanes sp. NPDC051513 TaxID=3363908 RepID=UPI00378E8460
MTPRLRGFRPGDLNDAQRAVYDAIAGGPRANGPFALVDETGALRGPFNAMLLQPELGAALQALGGAIRYRTALDVRAREIATLTVARAWDSAFERHAHEAVARAAGMSETEVTALRDGDPQVFTDPRERLIFEVSTALAVRNDLTDDEYAAAVETLGEPALFELTTLVGYYATLALQLRVFRVQVPGVVESD